MLALETGNFVEGLIAKPICDYYISPILKKYGMVSKKIESNAEAYTKFCLVFQKAFMKPVLKIEKYAYIGAISVALDSIFDDMGKVIECDKECKLHTEKTKLEKVYNELHDKLLSSLENREDVLNVLKKLLYFQKESLKQKGGDDLGREEIGAISRGKGGHTYLFIPYIFDKTPDNIEKEFFYDFGGLLQLIDDYIDCEKDKKEGIRTLFTIGAMNREDLSGGYRLFIKKYALYPFFVMVSPLVIEMYVAIVTDNVSNVFSHFNAL